MTSTQPPHAAGRPIGLRGSLALFVLGILGVIAAIPTVMDLVGELLAGLPDAPDLPLPALAALALINPLILLALGTLAGALCAHRVGLRSRFAERVAGAPLTWREVAHGWRLALALGAAVGVALVVLDGLTLPLLGPEGAELALRGDRGLLVTVAGVLYGGITEEVMVRWGLMSLLAYVGWRVSGAASTGPRPAVMWAAIVLTAVAFGALHLPTVAAVTALTPAVVARTLALNALGGVVFGWLFWRRGLEAAMIAHAAAHVAITSLALATGG